MTCSVMRDRYVIGAIAASDKIQYHYFFFQIHYINIILKKLSFIIHLEFYSVLGQYRKGNKEIPFDGMLIL